MKSIKCISDCCQPIKNEAGKIKWYDAFGNPISICVYNDDNNPNLDC